MDIIFRPEIVIMMHTFQQVVPKFMVVVGGKLHVMLDT
jgi:hypothetical protein